MPLTPAVARPIGRSCSSSAVKRMAWPCSEVSKMSSSSETSCAPIKESPSFRLIAIRPEEREEKIAQVIQIQSYEDAPYLGLATKQGRVKKSRMTEYESAGSSGCSESDQTKLRILHQR